MDCESLEAVQARCADAVDVNETMQTSAAAGYALACFAQLQAGWRGASEVLFKLSAPKVAADARGWAQLRDMADAIPFAGGAVVDTPADAISVPTVFGDCTIVGEPGVEVWVHAIQRDGGEVAVHLYGEDQSPFAAVTGMSFQVLDPKMVAPLPAHAASGRTGGGTEFSSLLEPIAKMGQWCWLRLSSSRNMRAGVTHEPSSGDFGTGPESRRQCQAVFSQCQAGVLGWPPRRILFGDCPMECA